LISTFMHFEARRKVDVLRHVDLRITLDGIVAHGGDGKAAG
jgi:hypothetical protein